MKRYTLITIISALVLALSLGCASAPRAKDTAAVDDAVLTGIKVEDNAVVISASRDFTYTLYRAGDPYKVTLDIPGISAGAFTGKIVSDKPGVTDITPQPADGRGPMTRLEITLQSPSSVVPIYKDNILTLHIKAEEPVATSKEEPKKEFASLDSPVTAQNAEPAPAAAEPAQPAKGAEPSMGRATVINSIDLQQSDEGVKILISGNGFLMPNVFPLNNRIVVDIPDVVMTASVPKAMMSPLKGIRAGRHQDKVRLVVDLTERSKFDVAAIGNTIEISLLKRDAQRKSQAPVKAASAASAEPARDSEKEKPAEVPRETVKPRTVEKPAVAAAANGAAGKCKGSAPISLDFQDAEVGPIFRLLADVNGCNLVLDPSVKGKITIKLMNIPWDQAVEIVSRQSNQAYRIDDNILYVAPTSVFEKLAQDQAKMMRAQEDSEPIFQEVVRVNYASAGDISSAVTTGKLLSTRGNITIDQRMNTLIVKDTQKSIDKIKNLVKIMDVSKPQVMIEARIVQVSSNYSQTLGIRWGGGFNPPNFPTTVSGNFSVNTPTTAAGSSTTNPGGVLGLSVGYANTFNVDMSLQALESVRKAKTLSNPKVLTIDNEAATIQQGQTFFIATVSQAGTQTTQQSATLSLNVTPKITPDGYISLKVTATDNALASVTPPVVDTKSLTTQALVKNGETLVLGGIYKSSKVESEEGIPIVNRIPVLGWLFKTKNQSGPDISELLIFITPTIVSQPSAAAAL